MVGTGSIILTAIVFNAASMALAASPPEYASRVIRRRAHTEYPEISARNVKNKIYTRKHANRFNRRDTLSKGAIQTRALDSKELYARKFWENKEWNPSPGTIYFDDGNGKDSHLTNNDDRPERIKYLSGSTMSASGKSTTNEDSLGKTIFNDAKNTVKQNMKKTSEQKLNELFGIEDQNGNEVQDGNGGQGENQEQNGSEEQNEHEEQNGKEEKDEEEHGKKKKSKKKKKKFFPFA
ncbi:hypothetical protein AMATHDRAFT_46345 [Amanita thiersii Skay4041]|uniref:Uncharacterized protein n=1 Tax=Amanita thiersii Skay4041 TaxID=703135 RepID=A0A2A9NW01_9AGAR|nr:hypothetical protein AMATHDRAFT_46345 [Amanita thiersii Skay4041]